MYALDPFSGNNPLYSNAVYTIMHLFLEIFSISFIRCPDDHARPSFRDIHMSLSQDQAFVLHVPEEAASTHPQAAVLGAPLEAGENMYIELQKSYL